MIMIITSKIIESGVVAVIRGANEENIIPIAKALGVGGVDTLEITVETPKAVSLMLLIFQLVGELQIYIILIPFRHLNSLNINYR
ncbi:hypothetical protein [Gracilibacillus kekensis]|uniref:2-dehydro-3-deoxyphosphogluconate aldolase / (4S)-4-hydroxy-2-oxoglutarate aldolase n=1 Tax=Gracilibacillus kekensis TaxID=1027249 RepID=A0A1M7QT10_9BACI|nr:hypothetical protein [Gracilibacillus kekensis]SHN34834.1 2-dehydro-3-deoxyphosphogluconate aldolase / (4S)-4-hydroxy-2-oxoglutarate aldolase [Gracilibacillus kekensis]